MTSRLSIRPLFPLPSTRSAANERQPFYSTRGAHIARLHDILHICIQRRDFSRARRAWSILARCRDVPLTDIWRVGMFLVFDGDEGRLETETEREITYLRGMMLQLPDEVRIKWLWLGSIVNPAMKREEVLRELAVRMMRAGRMRPALDEVLLYLPSFPFAENASLHTLAGMLCLLLAQPAETASSHSRQQTDIDTSLYSPSLVREARVYLERAVLLDKEDTVASEFLQMIKAGTTVSARPQEDSEGEQEEEQEDANSDASALRTEIRREDNFTKG